MPAATRCTVKAAGLTNRQSRLLPMERSGWPSHQTKEIRANENNTESLSAVALAGAMVLPVLADDATTPTPRMPRIRRTSRRSSKIRALTTSKPPRRASPSAVTSTPATPSNSVVAARGLRSAARPIRPALQFDTNNNNFNVNAVKIALEKALPDKNEWAAGFRIDTIYGSDAKFLGDTAISGSSQRHTTAPSSRSRTGLGQVPHPGRQRLGYLRR